MVFVHGVGLDHESWEYVLADFDGRATLVYDMLGHGQTKQTLQEQNFEPFKNQLDVLIRELKLPQVVLVGFSLGGLVAAHYAESQPQSVKSLVLISTAYQRTNAEQQAIAKRLQQAKDGEWDRLSAAALDRWFSPEFLDASPEVRRKISLRLQENRPDDFLASYELLANSDRHPLDYPSITMPTLILTGDEDVGSTPQMARGMERVIPNARCEIISKAKHFCIIENHGAISASIKRFLEEVPA